MVSAPGNAFGSITINRSPTVHRYSVSSVPRTFRPISVPDPEKSAQFYEAAFGLTRVGTGNSPLATSVYLSDGVINVTLLKYKSDEAAGERGRSYVGPHHVGFLVEDLDEARHRVEQLGATFFMGAPGAAPGVKGTTHFEEKFRDPDGIIFDISGHGWAGTAEWSKPQ